MTVAAARPERSGPEEPRAGEDGPPEHLDWVSLLVRARRLPPRWGLGDRLAVGSLATLLFGLVLPWGPGPYARPLTLTQAAGTGGVLAGGLLASVVVAVGIARRSALRSGLPVLLSLAGVVAGLGSLAVRVSERHPLPLVVPGRVATLLGGIGLVVAGGVLLRSSSDLEQEVARQRLDRLDRTTARRHVEQMLVGAAPDRSSTGMGRWGAAAPALLVVAATAVVAGPWWRMANGLHGPAWLSEPDGPDARPILSEGQSGALVRSGIDVLGDARAWAVGGLTLLVIGVVVVGARRAAPAVAVIACAVAALAAAGVADDGAGWLPLPRIAAASAVAAAAASARTWWSAWRRPHRFAVVPGVLLGLSAVVVVEGPPAGQGPTTDGPYRVLAGASPDAVEDDRVAGVPADQLRVDRAMWFQGEPAALTDTGDGVVLWTVHDGKGQVRAATEGSLASSQASGSTADIALITYPFGNDLPRPALWAIGEAPVPLPEGVNEASLGPDGQLWMSRADGESDAIHVAPVEELTGRPHDITRIDEWREVLPTAAATSGMTGAAGGVLVGVGDSGEDGLALVEADGSARVVLGSPPDATCGLNREATGSVLDPDYAQVDDRHGSDEQVDLAPLELAVSAQDGGLWVVLPASEREGDRVHALGRVDPDGTLRIVDHALPPIESMAAHPDRDAVLLVDGDGRLLELEDADRQAEALPRPPDGCYPEVPTVAPPAQMSTVSGTSLGVLLDPAGTRLRLDQSPTGEPRQVSLVSADGTEDVIAETDVPPVFGGWIVPDGDGGAWWLGQVARPRTGSPDDPANRSWAVRPVHLLATGEIDESAPAIEIDLATTASADIDIAAAGDTAYVVATARPESGTPTVTVTRVGGATTEVVHRGAATATRYLSDQTALAATRGGEVVRLSNGLVRRLLADRAEPVAGAATAPAGLERTLPVEIAAGLGPDQVHLAGGAITADPRGDGVLLVQDGVVARIGLDGSMTPIAQDPRLVGDARLLDGELVVDDDLGNQYIVELP